VDETLRACQRTAEQSAGRVADRTKTCPLAAATLPPPKKVHIPQFRPSRTNSGVGDGNPANWSVNVIDPAQAAIGNARAKNARTAITRLMSIPLDFFINFANILSFALQSIWSPCSY